MQLLLQHQPQVVHFSGHGTRAEQLILLNEHGVAAPVGTEALVSLFTLLKDKVRLVLLNACHSEPQAEAISRVIDCVIGMGTDIGHEAATTFASSFYEAVGFGRGVKTAFELGKAAVTLNGIPEEETPILFARKGIEAKSVFLVSESPQNVLARSTIVEGSPVIFISYSHKDKKWLEELLSQMVSLQRAGTLSIWDDSQIQPGEKWKDEIRKALAKARVGILLVSRHFLASDFIAREELPPLLTGKRIFWVAVGASRYMDTAIRDYQAANDPNRPMNKLRPAQRDEA